MDINENQIILDDPADQIRDILKMIGLDDIEIAKHQDALLKLSFMLITDDLNKISAFKDKEPFPTELKSWGDLFEYYEKYIDREMIKKIVTENVQKVYSEYLKPIVKELE